MSRAIELNLNPDERTLKQFGFIALFGFSLFGYLAYNEALIFAFGLGDAREPFTYGFVGVAGLCALLSLVAPKANKPVYVGLAVATYPIGFVLSYVIMGLLFFGLFTPLALAFKLIGRDSMHRTFDSTRESYWEPSASERPKEQYFRQF